MKGNQWIINGQKVWTTSAHKAHWGLLLARADWDQVKHKGLAYFILDMKQPGVQVHPLKQMNGYASFNQVFFSDALVEPEMMLCDVGDGWKVATTTLMHERRNADGTRNWAQASVRKGRIYEEEKAEVATTMEPYKWYPQRAGRVDLILPRARETGQINDPVVRQEIAKLLIHVQFNQRKNGVHADIDPTPGQIVSNGRGARGGDHASQLAFHFYGMDGF